MAAVRNDPFEKLRWQYRLLMAGLWLGFIAAPSAPIRFWLAPPVLFIAKRFLGVMGFIPGNTRLDALHFVLLGLVCIASVIVLSCMIYVCWLIEWTLLAAVLKGCFGISLNRTYRLMLNVEYPPHWLKPLPSL